MFASDAFLLAKLASCGSEIPGRGYDLSRASSAFRPLAERLGAAVVLVSHLTKGGSANGKDRVSGSIADVGACRANFLFVPDPRDPACRRVLMLDNEEGCIRRAGTGLGAAIARVGPPDTTFFIMWRRCLCGPQSVDAGDLAPLQS
jgi:hypothetical protein